ncbi:MAG TPA: rhodanese-like domain-containing protein [Blastocatellia bacterium]|nr:rhodanese-like domain-containing protein [Blastocatellia bacterium]
MKRLTLILTALFFVACAQPAQLTQTGNPSDPLHDIKQTVREKFPQVKQLSTADLATWIKDTNRTQPLLLDARTPEEFAVSHLHGARNGEQIAAALKDYPKDQPIVTYCAVGYRSSVLADKLRQQGFTNVANLEGSIFQWANEGRPLYKGEALVQQVHPFDTKWGQMLKPDVRAPLP